MPQLPGMTAFACPFLFAAVLLGSSAYAYSSKLENLAATGIASDWHISTAPRGVQYARSVQKNVARRTPQGHFVHDHYQSPTEYKTLPDEVLQNRPPFLVPPGSHFQSLEYEANNYRPASKYPQSIETFSHNYRRQPSIFEEQYQRRPNPSPSHQYTQESNIFDQNQNQRPHASPYVQLEQQQNHNDLYIDYPPYPNQNLNANQLNPNPNLFSSYDSHKQQSPHFESSPISPQFQNNLHSPNYPAHQAHQFSSPSVNMQRFPHVRDPNSPYSPYSPSPSPYSQHPRNPAHNKPHNPYFFPSSGHSHPPQKAQSHHPPSYYDPDPELTAELQQLDKEFHAEREGLSPGKSMYRLLVPLLMLGFSIPALGYMYTYMGRRRGFRSGVDNDQSSERLEYYSYLLTRAMACYQQGDKCLEQERR